MPRLSAAVPKYCRHRSTNRAFVAIDGNRHYLGGWRSPESYIAYRQLLAAHLAKDLVAAVESEPNPAPASAVTVAHLADQYAEHAKVYYRKRGKPTREAELIVEVMALLAEVHGSTDAETFGPARLIEVREHMIGRGWTRGFINRQVSRIKRGFKHAVAREWIAKTDKVAALADVESLAIGRSTAPDNAPIEGVSSADFQATLAHLPEVVADMARFQRIVGARPGELVTMTPGAIDRSGDIWIYRILGHKMEHKGRARIVAIGPRAQRILQRYLLRANDEPCFSPRDSERKRRTAQHEARVTPERYGNRPGTNVVAEPKRKAGAAYTVQSYGKAIRRAALKAGIKPWTPHQLRHAAATAVRNKLGLDAAQAMLGHAHADMAEHYGRLACERAIEVARKVG